MVFGVSLGRCGGCDGFENLIGERERGRVRVWVWRSLPRVESVDM